MKAILLVAVVLAASVPTLAQKSDDWKVSTSHDKFRDITLTVLEPQPIPDSSVFLFAVFDCPGQSRCRPQGVMLGFAIVSLSEPYSGRGMARNIRDGVRNGPYQMKDLGAMTISLVLPSRAFGAMLRPEALLLIANSKQVEYQIDSLEFTLSPQNLAALRDVASRIQS